MSEEKYRVVEKIGPGMQMVMATGTMLGCKQFLIEQIDKDYTRIMNIEPNPFCKPKLMPYQQKAIDDLRESFKKPELIQGYTAEQWQEIIDGGYLCEVRDSGDVKWCIERLGAVNDSQVDCRFIDAASDNNTYNGWDFCRPAQIKGVMRPIFVEPVDKEAECVFFAEEGNLFLCKFNELPHLFCATKYIEL